VEVAFHLNDSVDWRIDYEAIRVEQDLAYLSE